MRRNKQRKLMTSRIGNAVRPNLGLRGHTQMVKSDFLIPNKVHHILCAKYSHFVLQKKKKSTPTLLRRRLLFVNYNMRSSRVRAPLASTETYPETHFFNSLKCSYKIQDKILTKYRINSV